MKRTPSICLFASGRRTWIPWRCMPARPARRSPCTSRRDLGPILAGVIGIFGGTFDPPHMGHLAVATAAVDQLQLDRLLLIPAGEPWQKSESLVTAAHHRLAMTKLAAAEDPRFVVDDREIRRAGPSFTIDTLREIGERCVLILGTDAAAGVPTWAGGADILSLADIAVIERPGVSHADVEAALGVPVAPLSMPAVELSATALRSHIREGRSPRFLVPEPVRDYIESNGLYR